MRIKYTLALLPSTTAPSPDTEKSLYKSTLKGVEDSLTTEKSLLLPSELPERGQHRMCLPDLVTCRVTNHESQRARDKLASRILQGRISNSGKKAEEPPVASWPDAVQTAQTRWLSPEQWRWRCWGCWCCWSCCCCCGIYIILRGKNKIAIISLARFTGLWPGCDQVCDRVVTRSFLSTTTERDRERWWVIGKGGFG